MSEVTISYKGSSIATMDASGTKTLLTEGKYMEDDVEVVYARPSGGGGGNKSYIIKDGKIQSGYTFSLGTNNLMTEETGDVDYVKFTSNGNNYAWANVSVDMTNYYAAVVEFVEIDGHYGTGYTNITGISIGSSYAANQTMYADAKCRIVPDTGYIPKKLYAVGRPSDYTSAYLKLSNSGGNNVPGTSGIMNIKNLYLLGE